MTSEHMARALELAASVQGSTSPNPWVGCVLVRDGKVVAEGATEPPPGRHAEAVALQSAGDAARGSTAYVTLEPHNFHGRTPPCTDALIAAGVAAVHVAIVDPNPEVSGKGVEQLGAAGIEVTVGDGEAEASRLLEAYLKHRRTGLPFVTVKFAATLDGKIAAASGDSRWVAGDEARAWAHDFRTKIDAIMCGVNNVLLDDPQLTARPDGVEAKRQPLRIVADSRGRTPLDAKVLGPGGKTIIATTAQSPGSWREEVQARGAQALVLAAGEDGRVDLHELMHVLGERGVLSLLCEGGGVLHASMFAAGLVDKVHAIIAPKIVGGEAYPAVAGPGVQHMADALVLRDVETVVLGRDVAFVGYVEVPDLTLQWAKAFVSSFAEGTCSTEEFCGEGVRLHRWASSLPDLDPGFNILWQFCMWHATVCGELDDGDLSVSGAKEAAREMHALLAEGQESWAKRVQEADRQK